MSKLWVRTVLFTLPTFFVLIGSQPPKRIGRGSEFLTPITIYFTNALNGGGVGPSTAKEIPCRAFTFRSFNGRCTSAKEPNSGEARRAQFNYLRNHTSTVPTGLQLKSPRVISNILSEQHHNTVNSYGLSELFVFFGQFLDHNLVATPTGSRSLKISVPKDDPVLEEKVLSFNRSLRDLSDEYGNERPINVLSSAIDLSAVYGASSNRSEALVERNSKDKYTGRLKTSNGTYLPLNRFRDFNAPNLSASFYLAGDHRVNEHPALTALHTVFLREHNRLCDLIKTRLPNVREKRLFEYARAINIAQFQKIVYEEFYPAIISRILPVYRGHNRDVNPTISDIFSGAAFRVGHTMVGNEIKRKGPDGFLSPYRMSEMFFRPAPISSTEIDNVLRAAACTVAQEVDLKVVDALRNMLFEHVAGEEGFDLVALNIQRGRDHALPKFNEIRDFFGIERARRFEDISSDRATSKALRAAYDGSVDDVEAWPGMMAEDKVQGSGMGRTMEAVWRREFLRLRDGDRFFYLRRQKFPDTLKRKLGDLLADIWDPRQQLFRDLLMRNTGLFYADLPIGVVFKA